jgi:hypothetical protein
METDQKPFDAVATMRKIRDRLSRRLKGKSFAEQKLEMERLAKRKSRRSPPTKRRTA